MRITAIAAVLLALLGTPVVVHAQAPAPRTLQLTFGPAGRVTLSAQNVTVSEILADWARKCGCYVVNADRLSGGPISIPIQFDQAPQGEVLAALLRQAAGYVLTPSRTATSASSYETIYIVPVGVPPTAPAYSAYAPSPVAVPITTVGSPADEIPPITPVRDVPPPQPTQNQPPRPASPGVSVPLTTVTPFSATPSPPQQPAPARGGVVTPPR